MARVMKDSGFDWIGTVPQDWSVWKLKYLLDRPMQYGANETGVVYSEELPRYVRITDITPDNKLKDYGMQSLPKEVASEFILDEGDILFARSGATVGKTFIYKKDYGLCAFAGYLIRAITNEKILPKYIYYFTLSSAYESWKNRVFIQSTIQNIGADKYSNMQIAVPSSIDEQRKIVVFLENKLSEIDAIISKTRESIEEYKKYKQAVITEVAVGGLDKSVATRNSGIDWIGNIPEHWKIKPFKFVMTERNEKNIPVKTDERLALSIDKGITTYAEKTTNLDRFKDDVTQYKLAYEGDLVFNSMNMIVGAIGYSNYFGCVSPVYYTYYDNVEGHYTSKYYEYIFRSKTMRKVLFSLGKGIMAIDRGDDKINTCRLKVSRDDLRCLKVPVPTEQEQQEIVKYLDAKCAEIDVLIAKKEAFVEEMEAYKKSLIYEYVTGKKEVL